MDSHLLVQNASLRMEAWVASSTGREHARLGMVGLRMLLLFFSNDHNSTPLNTQWDHSTLPGIMLTPTDEDSILELLP